MHGQYDFSLKSAKILQTQTIMPRLYYSHNLLGKIIDELELAKSRIKKSNRLLLESNSDALSTQPIDYERTVSFSLETLKHIQKRIHSFSRIDEIPKIFPSLVPVIRTISAKLVDILPGSSLQLSELSVHLGSIVLDSAALTKAQFDFSHFNLESSLLLDEVKLMVDSKISKQYPQLDFF